MLAIDMMAILGTSSPDVEIMGWLLLRTPDARLQATSAGEAVYLGPKYDITTNLFKLYLQIRII
jgi:hypothetical protein